MEQTQEYDTEYQLTMDGKWNNFTSIESLLGCIKQGLKDNAGYLSVKVMKYVK